MLRVWASFMLARVRACLEIQHAHNYLSLPPSLSLSHTLFTGHRERERERQIKRDGGRERERERGRERE